MSLTKKATTTRSLESNHSVEPFGSTKQHSKLGSLCCTPRRCALGEPSISILDFDCCRTMSMDEVGVDQAVQVFLRNDPFYPRPNGVKDSRDQGLWDNFRAGYCHVGFCIPNGENKKWARLPHMFIRNAEEKLKEQRRAQGQDTDAWGRRIGWEV